VRVSNTTAITMYKNLGYIVYRTVLNYYSGNPDEDAYGKLHAPNNEVNQLCSVCRSLSVSLHLMVVYCIVSLDMRKALSADVNKKSVIPLDHPVHPEDLE
jgi:N-terminal acetyltransferase B complex catalytic subunit